MANKEELEYHDPAFMDAFNEDAGPAGGMDLEEAVDEQDGGDDLAAAESAGDPEGAPASVVAQEDQTVKPSAEVQTPPTEGEEEAAAQAAGKTGKEAGDQSTTSDEENSGEAAKDARAQTGNETGSDDPLDLSDVPPEDLQKAKSWAGRLKKMEEELKAKLAAANGSGAPAQTGGEQQAAAALESAAAGNGEQAAAAAELQQQVEAGEISAVDAMKALSEDFGDDFVRMVASVAKSAVGKQPAASSEELEKTKAELEALRTKAARDHYEAIYDEHPDFVQVYEDPAFRQWATANKKDDVVEAGSARQINRMLSEYKKAAASKPAPAAAEEPAPKAAKVDQEALDAAEGVRGSSGGARLPEKPARANDDFAAAFDEFN